MLDHISLTVSDVAISKAFYDAALAPLGITALSAGPVSATPAWVRAGEK